MQLPESVIISNFRYNLRMITFFKRLGGSAAGGNHFFAAIKVGAHWLHYDGMNDPRDRFLPINPSHYANEYVNVNTVCYLVDSSLGPLYP